MSKNSINLKEKSVGELQEKLKVAREEYQKMRFDHVAIGLPNPQELVSKRKNIARIQTELRERELAEMPDSGLAKRSKLRARRSKNKKR